MYQIAEGREPELVNGGIFIIHAHGGLALLDSGYIALSVSSHVWRAVGLTAWRKTAVDARGSLNDGHAAVRVLEVSTYAVVVGSTSKRCRDIVYRRCSNWGLPFWSL